MSSRTSWAEFVTSSPVPFCVGQKKGRFTVLMGDVIEAGSFCIEESSRHVSVGDMLTEQTRRVPVCQLNIARQHLSEALVAIHPFSIPHLAVTGQLPRAALRELCASETDRMVESATLIVTEPCELLDLLGVPMLGFEFSTTYDVEVMGM